MRRGTAGVTAPPGGRGGPGPPPQGTGGSVPPIPGRSSQEEPKNPPTPRAKTANVSTALLPALTWSRFFPPERSGEPQRTAGIGSPSSPPKTLRQEALRVFLPTPSGSALLPSYQFPLPEAHIPLSSTTAGLLLPEPRAERSHKAKLLTVRFQTFKGPIKAANGYKSSL